MTYKKPKWLLNEEAAEALENCNNFADGLLERIHELEAANAALEATAQGLRLALLQSVNFFQEAADYAEAVYNKDDTTVWIIARAGEKAATEALQAQAANGTAEEA